MTVEHLADERIERFLSEDMTSSEAQQVASHIDECSMCAARARGLDPLQPSFASYEDPDVPGHLVGEVLGDLPSTPTGRPIRLLAACMAAAVAAIAVSVMGSIGALDLASQTTSPLVSASASPDSASSVFAWLGIGVLVAIVAGSIAVRQGRN